MLVCSYRILLESRCELFGGDSERVGLTCKLWRRRSKSHLPSPRGAASFCRDGGRAPPQQAPFGLLPVHHLRVSPPTAHILATHIISRVIARAIAAPQRPRFISLRADPRRSGGRRRSAARALLPPAPGSRTEGWRRTPGGSTSRAPSPRGRAPRASSPTAAAACAARAASAACCCTAPSSTAARTVRCARCAAAAAAAVCAARRSGSQPAQDRPSAPLLLLLSQPRSNCHTPRHHHHHHHHHNHNQKQTSCASPTPART